MGALIAFGFDFSIFIFVKYLLNLYLEIKLNNGKLKISSAIQVIGLLISIPLILGFMALAVSMNYLFIHDFFKKP